VSTERCAKSLAVLGLEEQCQDISDIGSRQSAISPDFLRLSLDAYGRNLYATRDKATIMSTLNESFSIPIDTASNGNHSKPGRLQSRVLKIIKQKGHFRHVTERSLLAADDSGCDENEDSRLQTEDSDEKETPEDRDVRLAKGKDDMLQQLSRAQNDTLAALELVSFLLSKHSSLAQSTLSEEIKGRSGKRCA
jgi:Subunit 17 of Mediator complex